MSERYKIIEKDGKKHLIKEGFICDTDCGELDETLTGKLVTRNIFGENFELQDKSWIFPSGDNYNVKKSDGEEGTMKKSWFVDDYEYQKKEEHEGRNDTINNYDESNSIYAPISDNSYNTPITTIIAIIFVLALTVAVISIYSSDKTGLKQYTTSETSKNKGSVAKEKTKSKKQDSPVYVPASLNGTWDGYYINYGRKINFQLNLNQSGSSISGSAYETYEDGSYTAKIEGQIKGNSITLVKNYEGRGFEPVEYVGKITNNKMRGKWVMKKTGSSGEWAAVKRS